MIDGLNDESSQMSDVRVTVMETATGKCEDTRFVYFYTYPDKHVDLCHSLFPSHLLRCSINTF
jgi:hypothetical protein